MIQSLVAAAPMNAVFQLQTGLRFERLTERSQLERLAPSWQKLLESSRPEAMQSSDWLLPWWDIYARDTDRKLAVGAFWAGEELVGLAPFCRRTYRYRGGLNFRRLEFLGSDVDENDGVCSEYLGIVAAPGQECAIVEATVHQVVRGAFGAWDEVVLSAMNGASEHVSHLRNAFDRADLTPHVEEVTTAPFVTLPSSWEAFLKQLSKSKRWNLKTQLKDFDAWAAGAAAWHEVRTEEDLKVALPVLADLHEIRWRAEGKTGVFAAPRFLQFHETYARRMLAQGKLELIWVEKESRPLASLYAFRDSGRVYFYQSGRVMDLPDRVRIGSVVVAQAIRRAIERGDREFDLLGGPARYKLAFTETTRPIVQMRVARPSLRESMRRLASRTLQGLRAFRSWWKSPACSGSDPSSEKDVPSS